MTGRTHFSRSRMVDGTTAAPATELVLQVLLHPWTFILQDDEDNRVPDPAVGITTWFRRTPSSLAPNRRMARRGAAFR